MNRSVSMNPLELMPDPPVPDPDESPVAGEPLPRTQPEQSAESIGGREAESEEGSMDLAHPLAQDLLLHPNAWSLWPAVSVLRWLLRGDVRRERRISYRTIPALKFSGAEILDVAVDSGGFELRLPFFGVASPGSALPSSDIERIIADYRRGGGIAAWLDTITDRFLHALEASVTQSNPAFALATGGRFDILRTIASIVGLTAPLTMATPDVLQSSTGMEEPKGAVGLSRAFLGPISASGLSALIGALTDLPVRVEEFTGGEIAVLRQVRIGSPLGGGMLGTTCYLAAAGVDVVIDGRSEPEAQEWARNPARRRSLYRLARDYIGSSSPNVTIYLELDPGDTVPPAALDGSTAIGGLTVLGGIRSSLRLPLAP